jgi:hypothetical protein
MTDTTARASGDHGIAADTYPMRSSSVADFLDCIAAHIEQDRAQIRRAALAEALNEGWLQHAPGCSAVHGDEYRCKCALRAFMLKEGLTP